MSTFVMVRTVCCETYKCTGTRCSICPNRPENQEALRQQQAQSSNAGFGRRLRMQVPATDMVSIAAAGAPARS
ncbi:MAG: hypothetical protein JNK87_22780 [Bryobacterales bacterium]|nr:hypothetical protein [Bryobacterales bacterium]